MFDRRFALLAEREAAALRESEERFRSLYRRTPLPLHSLDGDGLIEHVSDAWLDLVGYRREEARGRPLTEFMTEASAGRRTKVDWPRLLALGELRDAEYRFVSKAGEVLDAAVSEQVERDPSGQFIRVVGGLLDVTARRRAEAALRQSQRSRPSASSPAESRMISTTCSRWSSAISNCCASACGTTTNRRRSSRTPSRVPNAAPP